MPTAVQTPPNRLAELRRQKLNELIAAARTLPTAVAVPMRLLKLQGLALVTGLETAEVAAAISADAGLAVRMLALANSAAFAPESTVTTLSRAVELIGVKNLMPLAFGLSLAGLHNPVAVTAELREAFFRAALLKAVTAREVCRRLSPDFEEQAFLCGLLQDVALPFFHASDRSAWPEMQTILELQDPAQRLERELRIYGEDHAAAAGKLLRHLGLPQLFCDAAALHHHGPESLATLAAPGLIRGVEAASVLPHLISGAVGAVVLQRLTGKLAQWTDVTAGQPPTPLIKEIVRVYSSTLAALGTSEDDAPGYKDFLQELCAEVARCMELAVEESAAVITGLRQRESTLSRELDKMRQQAARGDYDGVTDALHRRAFLTHAGQVLVLARQHGTACVVGMADLDGFRALNQANGNSTGDDALRALYTRLASALAGRGIIGRLGDDEFAFVLVLKGEFSRAEIESRFAVALLDLQCAKPDGQAVPLRASVGMVSVGVPQEDATIEAVLRSADSVRMAVKVQGRGGYMLSDPRQL